MQLCLHFMTSLKFSHTWDTVDPIVHLRSHLPDDPSSIIWRAIQSSHQIIYAYIHASLRRWTQSRLGSRYNFRQKKSSKCSTTEFLLRKRCWCASSKSRECAYKFLPALRSPVKIPAKFLFPCNFYCIANSCYLFIISPFHRVAKSST